MGTIHFILLALIIIGVALIIGANSRLVRNRDGSYRLDPLNLGCAGFAIVISAVIVFLLDFFGSLPGR